LNFNLQVDCWCLENTNLPKLNESLLLFTENLAQSGQRTARELLGCRGWTACHGADVWFNTAPQDGNPLWATWFFGGVWLMQQLFDHYEYDPDPEYLKRIYPLMKGAAEFSLDILIKDPVTGYMVSCPSTSPENTFYDRDRNVCAVSMGAAGETQMIRKLFRDFLKMSETLGTDAELVEEVKKALSQLPPHRIGKNGQLQEWLEDFDEPEPTHRLFVHWYAAYPDDDITIRTTPELIEALRVSMDRRTDMMYRGLFGGWKINLRARLEEAEKAYALLHTMLTDVSVHPYAEDSRITPSMEGNQGVPGITAGIAEMLMQSYSGEILLLPALPVQWKTGAVKGLRARGGYDVDMAWEESKLSKAIIKAHYDRTCRLRTKTPVKVFAGNREVPCKLLDGNCVEFEAKSNETYRIEPIK
ncbi:MAG: glycoside hydrolase family 95 protein, partial [Tannerella sp.]|nr:glycoside hydrolase family 95 protein [Tannerella sp.]